jgi:hypothetical protein
MMEAVRTSETSVHFNVTTRRCIPEDFNLFVVYESKLFLRNSCFLTAVLEMEIWKYVLYLRAKQGYTVRKRGKDKLI